MFSFFHHRELRPQAHDIHLFTQVAKEMERLGFHSEASFCYAMSCYMKACDDRGSTPDDRMGMMLPLFNFIRELVMVPRFPLYGAQTVSGLNFHLAEEILCSIQARLCLYLMTPRTGILR